jgi:hypothetical protein
VGDDQTIRFGSVRYSTPDGYQGTGVWCRVVGDELVIVGGGPSGLVEIARHALSTPGNPRIVDAHYPHHRPGNGPKPPKPRARTEQEAAFLALGEGAHRWLIEAAATGAQRVRTKMSHAVELAVLFGVEAVDDALGVAAVAGRFADGDVVSILEHRRTVETVTEPFVGVAGGEDHSTQPGTGAWERFGQ